MKSLRVLGFIAGGSFLALRLAKADGLESIVVGLGLTGIECVAVEGLARFAERRRRVAADYRMSRAQIVALEEAVASTASQITDERSKQQGLVAELKRRETESFDEDRAAEAAAWAVEAAYRGAINANQRKLEGGAVEAFPPRTFTAVDGLGEKL